MYNSDLRSTRTAYRYGHTRYARGAREGVTRQCKRTHVYFTLGRWLACCVALQRPRVQHKTRCALRVRFTRRNTLYAVQLCTVLRATVQLCAVVSSYMQLNASMFYAVLMWCERSACHDIYACTCLQYTAIPCTLQNNQP